MALSVTTVGALLASVQGSSLVIALPDVLTGLGSGFLTIMWVLLGYLLITTALVPVVGRLGGHVRSQAPVRCRLRRVHPRLAACRTVATSAPRLGPGLLPGGARRRRRAADHQQHGDRCRSISAWTR